MVALVVFGVAFVASSGAGLATSPFEGSDGNMIVNTAGHTDWCTDFPAPTSGQTCAAPISGLRTLTDLPSGGTDNSFTQGTHEDDPNVVIAAGSIPPNKNDLTRAYAASETISGETFLYLAWERQPNPNGSANIDFELDQNASPGDFTQPGNLTINRTEGDILITYDFGGSGTPDLGLLTWLTTGHGHTDNDCEASGQKLPCWGNRIDLSPNSNPPAEAGVNSGTIDEVLAGGQLDAGSFGETKIDLSAIPGLFTPNTCKAFGNMFVKSRSSGSSIDAELKDFIAPAPVQVTNCATPTIETTIKNAADDSTVNGSLPLGSSVYDTASLGNLTTGKDPTGTLNFTFFDNGDCSGTGTPAGTGVALDGHSDVEGPLAAGDYSFRAQYISGNDPNYTDSAPSACEPLTIDQGSLSASTTIKNAADDSTVDGSLPLGSSVYDTTQVTGAVQGFDPTGSISYTFFQNGNCSGEGSSAGSDVALDGQSDTQGPLGAGDYSFQAQYIAGPNDNYPTSDVSACEPLTIDQGSLFASTTIINAADDSIVDGTLGLGSSVFDTTQVSGAVQGFDPTGSISYTFFQNGDCSGEGSSAGSGVALDGQSNTEGPLGAGSYSFQAQYIAGENDNYPSSEPSACEPLEVGVVAPSASTTLKNAATNATIPNGSTLPHGSSVYDTAQFSNAGGFPLTGTVSFRFFHNGTCSGDPASVQTGVAVGGNSAATGALDAGSYGFQAMYVTGNDPNHTDSAWSACEPFTIAPLIDLAVTKSGSPATQTLGSGNITWTMVVTNNGPDTATGVTISDPMPGGNTFVSATTTQGSCTGGAILNCSLGTIAKGGTVTITLVTTPSTVGNQVNTVTVVGNETESNTANNTATATVATTQAPFPPPTVFCVAVSKVTPTQLFVGRKIKLTIHVTQNKKAVKGVHVRITGPKTNIRTGASNSKGVITQQLKMKKAGILIFSPIASKKCNTKRVGVTGVFTPPVTG